MIIKHVNSMDVCFRVDSRKYHGGSSLKLKGAWVNQGFVESWVLLENVRIEIKKSDMTNWLVCRDDLAKCLRYAKWSQL